MSANNPKPRSYAEPDLATPRPWMAEGSAIYDPRDDMELAICDGETLEEKEDRANADLIVRAVNAHDDLVSACEAAKAYLDACIRIEIKREACGTVVYPDRLINAALAKARGEQAGEIERADRQAVADAARYAANTHAKNLEAMAEAKVARIYEPPPGVSPPEEGEDQESGSHSPEPFDTSAE